MGIGILKQENKLETQQWYRGGQNSDIKHN